MSADAYQTGPFRKVSDMETPLATVMDLLKAMAMLTETMDGDQAGVVQRLVFIASDACEDAERLRCELFRLTHPKREHFEKVGWPGDSGRDKGGQRNG